MPKGTIKLPDHHQVHDDAWYTRRLAPPTGRVRIVIDTDAANEIDDQFALAWALLSPEQIDVVAMYAAPFSFAHRAHALPHAPADAAPFNPPAVGMERSYEEMLKVYDLLGLPAAGKVFRGSAGYLPGRATPVHSEAVDHLIKTAREHWRCHSDDPDGGDPLYVVALGCVTNIASALLIAPDIIDHIVVVWTSAYPSHAPHHNHSFNLEQDLFASQYLFDSGVPHVYLPGYHVGAQLRLSLPEMARFVQGNGRMGDYLHHLFTHNPLWSISGTDPVKALAGAYSWVIWDVINIAWLLNPAWVPSSLVRTPALRDDGYWEQASARHLMREAYAVERDAIFGDFFMKLKNATP